MFKEENKRKDLHIEFGHEHFEKVFHKDSRYLEVKMPRTFFKNFFCRVPGNMSRSVGHGLCNVEYSTWPTFFENFQMGHIV